MEEIKNVALFIPIDYTIILIHFIIWLCSQKAMLNNSTGKKLFNTNYC